MKNLIGFTRSASSFLEFDPKRDWLGKIVCALGLEKLYDQRPPRSFSWSVRARTTHAGSACIGLWGKISI